MDPRNWGTKKSMYYHGDTADLEIGQDEVDAYEEEEAAKEVQASRYEQMDEDDFALSDGDDNDDDDNGGSGNGVAAGGGDDDGVDDDDDQQYSSSSNNKSSERMQTKRDTSKLSQKDARKLLKKQYPGTWQQSISRFLMEMMFDDLKTPLFRCGLLCFPFIRFFVVVVVVVG